MSDMHSQIDNLVKAINFVDTKNNKFVETLENFANSRRNSKISSDELIDEMKKSGYYL